MISNYTQHLYSSHHFAKQIRHVYFWIFDVRASPSFVPSTKMGGANLAEFSFSSQVSY